MDVVSEMSCEDKVRIVSTLSSQLVGDYSAREMEDIRLAVADADAEFEQGKVLSSAQMASALGL